MTQDGNQSMCEVPKFISESETRNQQWETKCNTSVQSTSVCSTIIREFGTSNPHWETKSSTSAQSKCAHHSVDASQAFKREFDTSDLPWNQMEANQSENRKERFYRAQNEKLRRYSRLQDLRTLKPGRLYSTCPSHFMYTPFDIANEVKLVHLTLNQPSEDKYSSSITLDEGRCPSTSLEKK